MDTKYHVLFFISLITDKLLWDKKYKALQGVLLKQNNQLQCDNSIAVLTD